MDNKSYTVRVPRRWARISLIVGVVALIVAPLTAAATHSFTDVPDTHTFHSDIEWLKDADVTRGCNPPANTLFCPEDNVKRGQMAAFMKRFAQYLGAEDGTPAQADNASQLAGKSAPAYESVVFADSSRSITALSGVTGTKLAEVSFALSTSGTAMVSSTFWPIAFPNVDASPGVVGWIQVDETTCNNSSSVTPPGDSLPGTFVVAEYDADINVSPLAAAAGVELSAGSHSVTLCAAMEAGTESADVWESSVVVAFSPGGSVTSAVGSSSAGSADTD